MSQSQDELYREATDTYGAALDRLARAYELDADKRRDLLQEVHLALWRSFETFEARCSLRTWVYRVAHNTAIAHAIRRRNSQPAVLMSIEDMDTLPEAGRGFADSDRRMALERLLELVHQLKPPDRQLMSLYLEDLDSAAIGEIMGLSSGNVRVQIHRIKALLARRFGHGGTP